MTVALAMLAFANAMLAITWMTLYFNKQCDCTERKELS